jgi:hypothetical protein
MENKGLDCEKERKEEKRVCKLLKQRSSAFVSKCECPLSCMSEDREGRRGSTPPWWKEVRARF